MFSYLDGFVTICSQVGAMEIVNLVNNMFTIFDKLTERHDVYKVFKKKKGKSQTRFISRLKNLVSLASWESTLGQRKDEDL